MAAGKLCPTCGAKMVEYKHGLSKGLVRALWKMAERVGPNEPVHIGDMKLTYSEQCNFQKLRYWGLVEKEGDPSGKGGFWHMTQTGANFLTGRISLPKWVRTYQAAVTEQAEERVWVRDVTKGWSFRPDYAAESIPKRDPGQQSIL